MSELVVEKLVIGNNLASAIYAYMQDATYIQNAIHEPFRFSYLSPDCNLEFLNMKNEERVLQTPTGCKAVGVSRASVWQDILFYLSLEGKTPFGGQNTRMRLKDNILRVVLKEVKTFDIKYDELFVFDDENVFGVGSPDSRVPITCDVYDWYDVNEGAMHAYDLMETPESLVKEIYFYKSPRICGNTNDRKDLVAVSHLEPKDLHEIESSDLYTRLKTVALMKEHGIRGDNGTKPKLSLRKREIKFKFDLEYETELENVRFMKSSEEDMFSGHFDW